MWVSPLGGQLDCAGRVGVTSTALRPPHLGSLPPCSNTALGAGVNRARQIMKELSDAMGENENPTPVQFENN